MSQLAGALGIPDEVPLHFLSSQSGVMRIEERGVNLDYARVALDQALEQAILALLAMRQTEGEAMRADLSARLSSIEAMANQIGRLSPASVDAYRQRLSD